MNTLKSGILATVLLLVFPVTVSAYCYGLHCQPVTPTYQVPAYGSAAQQAWQIQQQVQRQLQFQQQQEQAQRQLQFQQRLQNSWNNRPRGNSITCRTQHMLGKGATAQVWRNWCP